MAEEKQFENKIRGFLETLPKQWHLKYWGGGRFATAGIPDIIGCINGRFIGIEVKATKGKPSPLQIRNVDLINKAGGYATIVYPNQFEELQEDLLKISKGIYED